MARVTVEDCVDKVQNRFDLVLLAAHRARVLSSGAELMVDRDNDKKPGRRLARDCRRHIEAGCVRRRSGSVASKTNRNGRC